MTWNLVKLRRGNISRFFNKKGVKPHCVKCPKVFKVQEEAWRHSTTRNANSHYYCPECYEDLWL